MKYKELMQKVAVTPEMRENILQNVQSETKKKNKTIRFYNYKKIFATVACCAVLVVVASVSIPKMFSSIGETTPSQGSETLQYGSGIEQVDSIEQLEEKVGFSVEMLQETNGATISYFAYTDMAEIRYQLDTQEINFRKSVGAEDNSGIYTIYDMQETVEVGPIDVEIRGAANEFSLAIWRQDDFSYSLYFEQPVSKEELIYVISNIQAA